MTTITFNTGRTYTECGQRIAAQRLANGAIMMIDIDRGVDYLLPANVNLTQRDVMRAYDNSVTTYPSEIGLDYADYYAMLADLRGAANSIPSV
jgi:hypothetical protein